MKVGYLENEVAIHFMKCIIIIIGLHIITTVDYVHCRRGFF